jgi:hypothetical protein
MVRSLRILPSAVAIAQEVVVPPKSMLPAIPAMSESLLSRVWEARVNGPPAVKVSSR